MIKLLLSCFLTFFVYSTALSCTVRLSEFNPSADGAQAWRNAFDALAKCKGGTLEVDTESTILTPVVKNFRDLATQIVIRGSGSNSRLTVAVGGSSDGLVFQNLADLTIEKLTIIGGGIQGAHTADALNAIHLLHTNATIRQNFFVGLGAITFGSATIKAGNSSSAIIERNKFWGCRSVSAYTTGTVVADQFRNLSILFNEFWDYGALPNGDGTYTYYTTNSQAGLAWIVVYNQIQDTFANPIRIEDNVLDEGGYYSILVQPSVRLQSVKINRNAMNVGAGAGYVLQNIKYLEIDGGRAGWRPISYPPADVIRLTNVQYPTITNFDAADNTSANRLSVDSGTIMLRVTDSKFVTIVNNAQSWRIENGSKMSEFPLRLKFYKP